MQSLNKDQQRLYTLRFGQALFAVVLTLSFFFPASLADAGFFDTLKNIYQITGNIEKLQKDYADTKQQLDEQKAKLAESMRLALETEQRLLLQNRQLQEQNQILQTRLQAIEQVAQDKDKLLLRIKYVGFGAVALVILYFLSGRLIRVAVWRRQKRKYRH